MIATIIVGIFSVLFAYLAKYKNTRWGLKVSFTLIFIFLALRYDFGNDYNTYLNAFIEINWNQSLENIFYYWVLQFEPGWLFINWLFGSLGFFAMTAALAILNCIVYYRFIKKYLPARYYWLAVFVYIFNPVFLLSGVSTMRQSVAIKDAIRYFICIGFASLFHISALVLLPVYLVGLLNWKISKATGVIIFSIFVSLFFSGTFLSPYIQQFIAKYFVKYVNQDVGELSSGLGFVYVSGMLILTLYFERLQNKETALIFKIAIISFMLMPLNLIYELSGRLALYFQIGTIIVYPAIFMNLKRPTFKIGYLTVIIVFTSYKFFQFFFSEIQKDYYGIYKTIFSAPQWY